jgi:AcrR family transcriptional regulator
MAPIAEIPRLRRVPRQARSRERVQRLLDAADDLLAAEGAESLTTTRVAEAAGVSVGSLYQYLPDKGAIIEALANRYLAEFEALMERLVEDAHAPSTPWLDPVCALIDAFAQRYRERPGYRALWFGRELTEELRAADRENKAALARGVRRILLELGLVRDDAYLAVAARTGVLIADSLLQEAFRSDATGDVELIEEAKRVLRLYLAEVVRRYREPSLAEQSSHTRTSQGDEPGRNGPGT